MNLYDLHEKPELLHGYSTREYHVPELAFQSLLRNMKNKNVKSVLEPTIMKSPQYAYLYAIINGRRWLKAEPYIMKDSFWAYKYASEVIKNRWKDAESYIRTDSALWNMYTAEFNL